MILEGKRQLARHLGVSVRTIERRLHRGMPRMSGGYFDTIEVENWLKRQGPAEELQAKPQELDFLKQPVGEEVVALFSAGMGGIRQGLKTVARALMVGRYSAGEARVIIFKALFNILLEQLHE